MPIDRICETCSAPFSVPPSVRKRFCSRQCFQQWVNAGGTRKGKILHCTICGTEFYVRPNRVERAKYCCFRCRQVGEGRKGGAVTGEIMKRRSRGRSYQKQKGRHKHRVLAEQKIGRPLRDREVVHHIDGNIQNNALENLEVLDSQAEHVRRHHSEMMKRRKTIHGY